MCFITLLFFSPLSLPFFMKSSFKFFPVLEFGGGKWPGYISLIEYLEDDYGNFLEKINAKLCNLCALLNPSYLLNIDILLS